MIFLFYNSLFNLHLTQFQIGPTRFKTKSIANSHPISFPKLILRVFSKKIGSNRSQKPCTSFGVPVPYILLSGFEGERVTPNLSFTRSSLLPRASPPSRASSENFCWEQVGDRDLFLRAWKEKNGNFCWQFNRRAHFQFLGLNLVYLLD